ncbi:MAG: LON peptidase substrate-binding domain-containing protein [Acidobacteria bacterium]|nr:LON peptidase substrate-binding domain-containing protein [Acidobacteriota bacterium]
MPFDSPEFEFIDQSQPPSEIPIFPLPSVVLFPNMALPLHIFEERYRQMVHDCLQGDRYLGIFLLQKRWEQAAEPLPYDVGGFGQIIRAVKLPTGNYEVAVRGLGKAQILSYKQEIPYRRAVIELIEDEGDDSAELRGQAASMVERLKKVLALRPGLGTELQTHLKLLASPRDLAYAVAAHYPDLTVYDRQSLLELRSVEAQLRQLNRLLNRDLARLN